MIAITLGDDVLPAAAESAAIDDGDDNDNGLLISHIMSISVVPDSKTETKTKTKPSSQCRCWRAPCALTPTVSSIPGLREFNLPF